MIQNVRCAAPRGRRLSRLLLPPLLCGITLLLATGKGAFAQSKAPSLPLPLKVVGAQVRNSQNKRVRLRGVNTASLEWSSDGEGHILQTVQMALRDWRVSHVRLPLSQDRWFGKAPEQTDDGKAYRALVGQIVDACAARNCYILLDLHWSNAGEWGKNIGQHVMPDQNSVVFWNNVATTYKNHPAVLFDLYNEPHDVTWDIWRKGGRVTERSRDRRTGTTTETTYQAVGMQTLLDTVRATGARNVVVAGGLDWSYDLSGILAGRSLSDPKGNGVIYANHAYPFKGDTVEQWIAKMETATKTLPVIVSEFGSEPGRSQTAETSEHWVRRVLQVLEDRQWDWTAWDLHPAAGPRLISDWNYSPTPYFGAWVRQALAGTLPPYAAPTALPATQNTAGQNGVKSAVNNDKLGPDSLPREGTPKGKLEGPFLFKSKILENTVRKYWVYVPAQYTAARPACVLVFQDGQRAINPSGVLRGPVVLDNLIHGKEIPVTIGIFITPGQRGDEYPESIGNGNPNNRSVEYDSLGDAYARFLVEEMLPEVGKTYNLTKDPQGRAIGGASSGAICAFTVAWERPNAFRKVISLIGSFTDIRGGHVYPDLVRKSDPRPLRIFVQDGTQDNRNPDNPARDWHLQNKALVAALKEKGYDMTYVFGEGGHSDDHGGAILPDILRWLWRDYPK